MKTFQTILVKVDRTQENEAILEKIRNKELFPADNLHSFSGNKDVYFTSETTSLELAVSTQRMLMRAIDREIKALSIEEVKELSMKEEMVLPIIIAKYLVRTKEEREIYTKRIEALTNVPFQAISLSFAGVAKEKAAFKKAVRKMQIAKNSKK